MGSPPFFVSSPARRQHPRKGRARFDHRSLLLDFEEDAKAFKER